MRNQLIAAVTILLLCGVGAGSAQTTPSSSSRSHHTSYAERSGFDANSTALVRSLAGVWKAPVYEVPLSDNLQRAVWGPKAFYRRNVELALEPSGDGILTVRTKVVDDRGRTKANSLEVQEARIRVTMPGNETEGRIEPAVAVVSAERRFPEYPKDRWLVSGLTVKLSTVASDPNRINLRFDTLEGRGSFGESLFRQGTRVATQAAR